MTDVIDFHDRAAVRFSEAVAAIRDDEWHSPTPCVDWTVTDLLAHNVEENLWVAPLMAGETIEGVGDRFEGDVLGGDPKEAWESSMEAACAAIAEDGALARTVHLSFGDVKGEEYVVQRFLDLLIHAWDLARAVRTDETLDPELCDAALAYVEPMKDMLAQSGLFAPPIEPPAEADAQTRLLCLSGRRP